MKFDFTSDLHQDIQKYGWDKAHRMIDWKKLAQSEILLIAGDTANSVKKTIAYLEKSNMQDAYKHILFTDGNHEFYDFKLQVNEGMKALGTFSYERPQFTYLNGVSKLQIDDTLFIGANGWYDFNVPWSVPDMEAFFIWQRYSNDSRINFGLMSPAVWAEVQAKLLRDHVVNAQDDDTIKNIVIMTHTVPVLEGLNRKPEDAVWEALHGAYHNSFMNQVALEDINKKIKFWGFGHTHIPKDFMKDHIRYVSNQHGYHATRDDGTQWTGPQLIELP